jgi:hypothetical protein
MLSMNLTFAGAGLALLTPKFAFADAPALFSDGFENGFNETTTWNSHNATWTITDTDAKTGVKSAMVTGDTGSDADDLRKEISTSGYKNIEITFWYRITKDLGPNDHVKVFWKNNTTSYAALGGVDIHNESAGS